MTRHSHFRRGDPPGTAYYEGNGDGQRMVSWIIGISATLVSVAIVAGATALYNMNAQLAVITYRLGQIERSILQ